jgi:ribosomal-protein-alanine N-acetyltransferase
MFAGATLHCPEPVPNATVTRMSIQQGHLDQQSSPETGQPLFRLDIMTQDDVAEVSRVERRCFPNPWPVSAYRRELQNPAQNHYVVLRALGHGGIASTPDVEAAADTNGGDSSMARHLPRRSLLPISLGRRNGPQDGGHAPIVGFAGMWLAFDEAHITTIGVDPPFRGRGLGEVLFLSMVDEAIARGANWLTLEVRVSNTAAQALYRKYGFTVHGTRKRYYSDNNEDAHIMWSRALSDPGVRAEIERRREALANRLTIQIDPASVSSLTSPVGKAGSS